MSESKAKLYAALAKAQAQIEGARKGNTNPHFRSKYADLASVWDACREALTSNGLSIIQRSVGDDPQLVQIETILCHESGAEVSGTITMRPVKADPQGIGSCITYARRYALAAMVGVAPEDDDGHAASQGEAPTSITATQAAQIKRQLHDTESDVPAFLAAVAKAGGVPLIASVDDIPASLHATCMTALKKKRAQQGAA